MAQWENEYLYVQPNLTYIFNEYVQYESILTSKSKQNIPIAKHIQPSTNQFHSIASRGEKREARSSSRGARTRTPCQSSTWASRQLPSGRSGSCDTSTQLDRSHGKLVRTEQSSSVSTPRSEQPPYSSKIGEIIDYD